MVGEGRELELTLSGVVVVAGLVAWFTWGNIISAFAFAVAGTAAVLGILALLSRAIAPLDDSGDGSSDSPDFDVASSVKNNPSYPFMGPSAVRVPCPACDKRIRNTRESASGHWKRTCDAGGVSRAEFRDAVREEPDHMPDTVFRDADTGDGESAPRSEADATGDGESAPRSEADATGDGTTDEETTTSRRSGWTTAGGSGRTECPVCGTRVHDSRDAFLAHWRNNADCPGPTRPEVGRLLDDPVEADSVPDDVLREPTDVSGPLLDVPGVDRGVAEALTAAGYGSVEDLRQASRGELTEVPKVGKARAARIKADVGGVTDDASGASGERSESAGGSDGRETSPQQGATGTGGSDGWLALDSGRGRRAACPACGQDVFNDRDAFVDHWRDKDDCPGPTRAELRRLLDDPAAVDEVPDEVVREPDSGTVEAGEGATSAAAADSATGGDGATSPAKLSGHPEFGARMQAADRRLDEVGERLDEADGEPPEEVDGKLETARERLAGAADLLSEVQAARGPDRLTAVAGVGDSRARTLRDAGYTSIDDLRAATTTDLAAVDGIGEGFATRLKAAVGDEIRKPTDARSIDRVGESRSRSLARAGYVTADDIREATVEELTPVVGERLASHLENEVGGGTGPDPEFVGPVADAHERLAAAWDRWRELRIRVERERARAAIADDVARAERLADEGDDHRADDAFEDAASAYREARDAYADALEAVPDGLPEAADLRAAKASVEERLAGAVATPDVTAAAEAVVEAEQRADEGEYEAALDRLGAARERYEAALERARNHDPGADIVAECEDALADLEETAERYRAERYRAAVEPHVDEAESREAAGEDHREAEEYEAAADAFAAAVEAYDAALDAAGDAYGDLDALREARAAAEHKHAVAERDAHVAAADEHATAAENRRDEAAYEAALEAFERAVGRLQDAVEVASEYDLAGVAETRARIEELEAAATRCELGLLGDEIVSARERTQEAPDGAESDLEEILTRLDAVDTERERDVALLRDEARSGLVGVARRRGETSHEEARDRFEEEAYDAAREAFEEARERFESARSLAEEHDLDVDRDELVAAAEVCEANADAARQALYGLSDGEPSLRPLPWADAADAAMTAGKTTERGVSGGSLVGDGSASTESDAAGGGASAVAATLPEYETREWVGSGGNADVYRVETTDGGVAALKVPRWEGTMHSGDVEAFVDEAETWERLDSHDHIADVLDWGTEPHPWLLLEYLPGSLAAPDHLPLAERLAALAAIADALEYAHGRGVVHLDVKPENVLLSDDDVPKVADWGLARLVLDGGGERTGMTLAYSAPEQLTDDDIEVDRQVDVYQFGVLAYEVLTGRRPFTADGRLELRRAILEADVDPPSEVADLPEALDDVLLRGLATDRAERYEACIQFRDALREVRAEID